MRLTRRQTTILRAVVEGYLETGRPVSSAAVADRLPLSPATVRNAMAELDERGLLRQPHTSAGRIPTDLGLRAYLDQAVAPKLHPWDRTHLDAARNAEDPAAYAHNLGQKLAGVASEMTVVAVKSFLGTRFLEIGLTRCRAGVFLAYFVTAGGLVQEKLVHVDFDLTAEELARIQNFLNHRLAGRSLHELRQLILAEMAHDAVQHDRLSRRGLELALGALPGPDVELVVEGAGHLAGKPELAAQLSRLLTAIEDKRTMLRLLDRILDSKGGVRVVLGSEHHLTELPELACIGTSLESPEGGSAGAITVLGPVRMNYGRLIPLVRYAAQLFGRRWEPL